jgi:hypothetical protein
MKRFATLALVLLFAACSEFTGADTTDHVGVYSISSVNGAALPFTLSDDGTETVEVLQGTVTLNADRTFTDNTQFRVTTDGVESTPQQQVQGQYLRSKSSVTFEGYDGSFYTGQLDGSTLTIMRVTASGANLEVTYTR